MQYQEYKNRVIQLGEDPKRVFNVGGVGIDIIKEIRFLSKIELEKKLKIKFNKKNLLVVYHPVTLQKNMAKIQIKVILY